MKSQNTPWFKKYWFSLLIAFLLCFVVFAFVHAMRVSKGEYAITTFSYIFYILGFACIETLGFFWWRLKQMPVPTGTKIFSVIYFPVAAVLTTLPLIYNVDSYLQSVELVNSPDDLLENHHRFIRFAKFFPRYEFLNDQWAHERLEKNNNSTISIADKFSYTCIIPISSSREDSKLSFFVLLRNAETIDGDMDDAQVIGEGDRFLKENHKKTKTDSLRKVTFFERSNLNYQDFTTLRWLNKYKSLVSSKTIVLEPHSEELREYESYNSIIWLGVALFFYFVGLLASRYNSKDEKVGTVQ
jgi:hypothetical protein